MLLCTKGAFRVSFDRFDAAWTGHLKLKISIVRHRVESSECRPSEQCVITTAEWDMSKINSSLRKLSGDPKTTSSVIEPV